MDQEIAMVPVTETVEIADNKTITRTRFVKNALIKVFDPTEPLPPAPYVKILDEDLPNIYEMGKRDQEAAAPSAPTAPAAPADASPAA